MNVICPHGDATCPCPDGDCCHYEGKGQWACPNLPRDIQQPVGRVCDGYIFTKAHCHVEGCEWPIAACGLGKLDVPFGRLRARPGDPRWACGFERALVAIFYEDPEMLGELREIHDQAHPKAL